MSRKASNFKYVPSSCMEMKRYQESVLTTRPSTSRSIHASLGDCSALTQLQSDTEKNATYQHHLSSTVAANQREVAMSRPTINIGQMRGSRKSIPSMIWTDENICVVSLIRDYSNRFPIIVKASRGYYGEGRFKLATGQVFQIYGSCEERRVKAIDSAGRLLSLPHDLTINVKIKCSKNNKQTVGNKGYMKLSDALEKVNELPITFDVDSYNGDLEESVAGLVSSQLTITNIYNCSYLLANNIDNGWLDSNEIVMIPEDLKATFNVACGLKEASVDEWKDYCGMFERTARHLKFSTITGFQGIIYEDWSKFCEMYPDTTPSPTGPLIDFDRYLINKQNSEVAQGNKRFPRTSPLLKKHNHQRSSTKSSSSSFSLDSIERTQYNSRLSCASTSVAVAEKPNNPSKELFRVSIHSETSTTWPRLSSDESVAESRFNQNEFSDFCTPPRTGNNVFNKCTASCDNFRTGNATSTSSENNSAIDEEELEQVCVGDIGLQVVVHKTVVADSGTLASVDEGYNTKEKQTSFKQQYTPVYF